MSERYGLHPTQGRCVPDRTAVVTNRDGRLVRSRDSTMCSHGHRAEGDFTMDPEHPDAWYAQATRCLEITGEIDLAIPTVDAATEAAVALATPLDAAPVTAATWLEAFQ